MAVQPVQISPALATVLNRAGDRSGVDFDYLLQTAIRESSLNPEARAPTSSAVGLFQFIESTWFEVMKSDGQRLGYGQYANAIERTSDGDYTVRDRGLRQEILALREDPQISADLAAAFTRNNGEYLQQRFGRQPSPGELYIAHFMGARGAERLFVAGLENPSQIAADLFPRQARANPSIFYDSGRAKTIRQVYESLVSQHAQLSGQPLATQSQPAQPASPVTPVADNGGDPVVQSRYGPAVPEQGAELRFETLFSTTQTGSSQSVTVDPGAAFFVQLYNQ